MKRLPNLLCLTLLVLLLGRVIYLTEDRNFYRMQFAAKSAENEYHYYDWLQCSRDLHDLQDRCTTYIPKGQ